MVRPPSAAALCRRCRSTVRRSTARALSDGAAAGDEAFELFTPWGAGQPFDERYTCDGDDISPPLSWKSPPAGTVQLAFAMVDESTFVDGEPFVHWVLAGVETSEISLLEDTVPFGAEYRRRIRSARSVGVGRAHRWVNRFTRTASRCTRSTNRSNLPMEHPQRNSSASSNRCRSRRLTRPRPTNVEYEAQETNEPPRGSTSCQPVTTTLNDWASPTVTAPQITSTRSSPTRSSRHRSSRTRGTTGAEQIGDPDGQASEHLLPYPVAGLLDADGSSFVMLALDGTPLAANQQALSMLGAETIADLATGSDVERCAALAARPRAATAPR